MANPYHYLFYVIARFFKKINKVDKDALDSSSTFISMCFLFHVAAIWFFLSILKNMRVTITGMLIASVPIFFINYLFLTKNNRGEKIFDFYNEKFSNSRNKKLIVMAVVLYVVFSVGSAIFLAAIYRNKYQH
jgi:hypothetical protein